MRTTRIMILCAASAVAGLAAEPALAQGEPAGAMQAVAVDPQDSGRLITAGAGSVYVSSDGGSTWAQASIGTSVWDIQFEPFDVIGNPGDSAVVLLATQDRGVLRQYGTDQWVETSGLTGAVGSVATDAGGDSFYAGAETGIYVSTDRGATWQLLTDQLGSGATHGLAVDPTNPLTLYAPKWGQGVYRSTDGGQTWQLGANGLFDTQIFDLDVRPDNGGVVFVPTPSGIFQSVDAGTTWVHLESSPARASELAIDPTLPDRMFAASEGNGLWRSLDGGQTWQRLTNGFGDVDYFVSVAVAPDGSGSVYAGTINQGLWISRDYGQSWTSVGTIGAPPSTNPPPTSPPAPKASLLVEIVDRQNGEAVSAGSNAQFRVTVRNTGSDPATDVILHVSWVRTGLTGKVSQTRTNTPSQGSCDAWDCRLGAIAAGATATVDISGSTEAGRLGWYVLTISSKHDGSSVWQGSVSAEIGSKVTIASGGGGASGLWSLLTLAVVLALRRSRSNATPALERSSA